MDLRRNPRVYRAWRVERLKDRGFASAMRPVYVATRSVGGKKAAATTIKTAVRTTNQS